MINGTFRKYLEEAIGEDKALVAFSAFDSPASTAVRKNPFKAGGCPEGRIVDWCSYGRILSERPVFTLDPDFHGGSYYVQDSSSMFVGYAFRHILKGFAGRPVRVLDLCAAPGGKTTDIAASLREAFGDDFLLVSNEVMKARAGVLADNVALWGDPNVVVTSDDPRSFGPLAGFFDIIVADVPCSGEGMFRKDEEAQRQWSQDNVALCAARQKRIVADVWPALAPGGVFIYSTCTFNRYENDDNVRWMAAELGAEPLFAEDALGVPEKVIKTELGYSLVPGHVEGEGQYCSALRKSDCRAADRVAGCAAGQASGQASDLVWAADRVAGRAASEKCAKRGRFAHSGQKNDRKCAKEGVFAHGIEEMFSVEVSLRQRGETVIAIPKHLAADISFLESSLHIIATGCAAGVMKGKTLVPDADLALSLIFNRSVFPSVDVDRQTALAFLHRDAITLKDAPMGYITITYGGLPLGFVKNLGNRCNNLHPQSRRIRMNIL